jgi:hypothetical protein
MKISPLRIAFAAFASLAMASSANADAILQFTQQNQSQSPVIATNPTSNTTRLTSTGTGAAGAIPPGWIPVFITFPPPGGGPTPLPQAAFMTFEVAGLNSGVGGATQTGTSISQDSYTGTIRFNSNVTGTGTNFLTATFTGGAVSGPQNGNSAGLAASQPPTTVTFTSDIPAITAVIAASPGRNFALSFSGLTSPLVLTGPLPTIDGFLASNTGTFSTIIPEPSSIVMASISALAGLGCLGLRRFKATQA